MNMFEEIASSDFFKAILERGFFGPLVSTELIRACEKAMSRKIEKRHASAKELAEVIKDWREGTKRTQQAQTLTQQAIELDTEINRLEAVGTDLIAQA